MDGILQNLPLHDWMRAAVTPLEPHPNDPASSPAGAESIAATASKRQARSSG
jgi:muconolactone delta-isomerase